MSLLELFKDFIRKEKLFNPDDHLLLAVSGGVDSVVLCYLCAQAGYSFSIAHCNFKLRAEESDRDEKFVYQLSQKLDVPFFVKHFDTIRFSQQNKISIQVAARSLRYEWFNKLLLDIQSLIKKNQKTWLLTAHHANDSAETSLMNYFKGTGIAGLRGILPTKDKIIRPLLFATKQQILDYAMANNLSWVDDSSNLENKYTRNFFRNKILPLAEEMIPQAEMNIIRNLQRFKETEWLMQFALQVIYKKILVKKGSELHIAYRKLLQYNAAYTILHELLKDFDFTSAQISEVLKLTESQTGKYITSSTYKIFLNRNWLILSPNATKNSEHVIIDSAREKVEFSQGQLKFELINYNDFKIDRSPLIAQLDAEKVNFPILLRKWKTGDYFYPLGMKKKKKLNRFFIDLKLSASDKEKIYVLEMNKKIIWVVGYRIDERFKITTSTKNILKILYQK